MQNIQNNTVINNDINIIFNDNIELFKKFKNKTILITGATGLIGSFLVKSLCFSNKQLSLDIKILALLRNEEKAIAFYKKEIDENGLEIIIQDINKTIKYQKKIDYIIHCASNTSSKSFVDYPVETLDVAICGTKNILNLAKSKKVKSIVYLSSMEIYGELDAQRGLTKEEDLGYIDNLKLRSSYQVGKRVAESYCSFYSQEYNVPVKIARLAQIISSNTNYNDSRVFAYVARCIVEKKDVVFNTPADNIRSYCYITDTISALLTILFQGENGQAYNIANMSSTAKIKDIVKSIISQCQNTKLIFDIKNLEIYPSSRTNWQLDTSKLNNLGWSAKVDRNEMFERLIASFIEQSRNL